MRIISIFSLVFFFFSSISGCGSAEEKAAEKVCEAGAVVACECSSGEADTRVCVADGTKLGVC